MKTLNNLKQEIAIEQKKGLPFMVTSIIIWSLITIVIALDLPQNTENILVLCCSCPLIPIAWLVGKSMKVNIFDKTNPLSQLGLLYSLNQLIYLLIVLWTFYAVPDKMVMVYAIVFGAHLLPYSWSYSSISYRIAAIVLPIVALYVGIHYSALAVSLLVVIAQAIVVSSLLIELKRLKENNA